MSETRIQSANNNNSARKPTGIINQQSQQPPPGVILVDGGFFESQFTTSQALPNIALLQSNAICPQNPQLISMSDITIEHGDQNDKEESKGTHNLNESHIPISSIGANGGFLEQVSVRKISGENSKKLLQLDNKKQMEVSLKNSQAASLFLGAPNAGPESRDTSQQIMNDGSFNNDLAFNNHNPQGSNQLIVKLLQEKSNDSYSNTNNTSSGFNIYSSSFDESGAALQLEMRPQRNCKSSTRKVNPSTTSGVITKQGLSKAIGLSYLSNGANNVSTNKPMGSQHQHQIPLLQNLSGLNNSQIQNAPLTAKLTNQQKKIETNGNSIITTKIGLSQVQQQNMTHQGQQKSSGANHPNSFDSLSNTQIQISQSANVSSHDLSNRSHLVQSSNRQQSSPYESQNNRNQQLWQQQVTYQSLNQPSVILSDGGASGKSNSQLQSNPQSISSQVTSQVDPQTFFKMKQQKYKSSRSNNPTAGGGYGLASMAPGPFTSNMQGGSLNNANQMSNYVSTGCNNQVSMFQFQRQGSNSNIMNNSQQLVFNLNPQIQGGSNMVPSLPFNSYIQKNKGNKTQKNNKSMCSSGGGNVSIMNSSSTGFTGIKQIKSLDEVAQPGETINLRFSDRKAVDLNGINRFKSLKELDVSGNLLTQDVPELRQLQFLIKLNLSNNLISMMYPVPSKLEYLNLSYNKLKILSPEAVKTLKNLRCLDLSGNILESLQGIDNMQNLKRLIAKNNQITDVSPLNNLKNIIEIDLENNLVENYVKLLAMVSNKKDILVLNLRFTPLTSSIQSYDQLCNEFETSCLMERPNIDSQESQKKSPHSSTMIDKFKKRLSYFDKGGALYRSQRVFIKLQKAQNSKRSSSNFSNGSSSHGRATGGRSKYHNNGNTSAGNSFSPLLNTTNNLINTPNQQQQMQNSATNRFEDVMQLYDNILEEEDRIKMKKKKKQNNEQGRRDAAGEMSGCESHDFEESMDLYGDEDDEGMHPFDEEDIDELQSYRNHHADEGASNIEGGQNEFLNESTADFGGVLKEINIKIRDELGTDSGALLDNQQQQTSSITVKPEHLQSFQSTQSLMYNNRSPGESGSQVNTLKKNPIFKLDLSKCTNNQLEDDDDEEDLLNQQFNSAVLDEIQDQEGLFENVKVTDDSFRQFHKNPIQKQNSQGLLHQIQLGNPQPQFVNSQIIQEGQRETQQASQKNQLLLSDSSQQSTIRSQLPPKPEVEILPKQSKFKSNVIVPKLPLAILKQQDPVQLSQYQNSGKGVINSSKVQYALTSGKEKCSNESCRKYKQAFQELRAQYEQEKLKNGIEIAQLRGVLTEIKEIFKYTSSRQDFISLPQYLRNYKDSTKQQNERANTEIQELNIKCEELQTWKNNQQDNNKAMNLKCLNNEKTISDLQYQLKSLIETQRTKTASSNDINQEGDLHQLVNQLMPIEIKRTLSGKYQQQAAQMNCLLNNPSYFYNSSSQNLLTGRISTNEADQSEVVSGTSQMPTSTKTSKYVLPITSMEAIQNYQVAPQQIHQLSGTATSRKKGAINSSQSNEVNKKIKRPQSVVTGINQRRSSQGIKINNMLKIDTSAANIQVPLNEYNQIVQHQDDRSVGANEYCSNQELMPHFDLASINALVNGIDTKTTPLSQTMNGGKSGNIPYQIQKMKERNSSLQDRHRLNCSFRENSGSHSAMQIVVSSPTPTQGLQQMGLNLKQIHYQQDSISNNPYILSPNNHKYNESINSANPKTTNNQLSQNFNTSSNQGYLSQVTGLQQNYQSLQIMTSNLQQQQTQQTMATPIYQNPQSTSALGKSLNLSTTSGCQLRKISYSKDNSNLLAAPNSTRRQSHYVASSSRDQQPAINQPRFMVAAGTQNEYEGKGIKQATVAAIASSANTGNNSTSTNKQHSKTQRIHVNRIQYNQMFSGINKTGYNSSLSKQTGVVLGDQLPLTQTTNNAGYQTAHNQSSQQINLTQLFSGRLMMRSDSSEQPQTHQQKQQNYTHLYHSSHANQSAPNKHS